MDSTLGFSMNLGHFVGLSLVTDTPTPTRTIESIVIGGLANGQLAITINAATAQIGDMVLWSMASVADGLQVASGTFAWPDAIAQVDLSDGAYILTATVGDSAPVNSPSFTVTTATAFATDGMLTTLATYPTTFHVNGTRTS